MSHFSIYNYSDYKTFLRDYYESKKKENPYFSLRVWMKKMNLRSPSTLSMILRNSRHPGLNLIDKFNQYFNFTENQRHYFELLVRLAKTKNENSFPIMERLKKLHPDKLFYTLDSTAFELISKWYFYAIREMINLSNFKEDYNWISQMLAKKITATDAKYAIEIMLKVGVLERDTITKKLVLTKERITTTNDITSLAIRRFHSEMITQAKESIEEVPTEERNITGSTLAIRKEKIAEAKKLIERFRREFCRFLEESSANAIYQLNIQFFPLTKTIKKRRKQ